MKSIQEAARDALAHAFADPTSSLPPAAVTRLSVSVTAAQGDEIVSMRLHDGVLSWSCTCATTRCEHAFAALHALGNAPRRDSVELASFASPDRRTLPAPEPRAGANPLALSEVLQDLMVAIVRSGASAGRTASVDDALERLRRCAPDPMPLDMSRWLGRIEHALATDDSDEVARALAAAAELIEDLRDKRPSAAAEARIHAFLGSPHDQEAASRLTDRTLIEIARERLAGSTHGAIERRYLIEPETGQVYREERSTADSRAISIGPCPRSVSVWLATLERGAAPCRVHLLQYAVSPVIEPELWQQLGAHAQGDYARLAERYRAETSALPGLCEPFALVAATGIREQPAPSLIDAAGRALVLAAPEGANVLSVLQAGGPDQELLWVCGRLTDQHGALALRAAGAAVRRRGRLTYLQL